MNEEAAASYFLDGKFSESLKIYDKLLRADSTNVHLLWYQMKSHRF